MPSAFYGMLQVEDSDRTFVEQVGHALVLEAINRVLARHNDELSRAVSIFIERTTSDYALRYAVPGGGYMQEMGRRNRAESITPPPGWDVQLPLLSFGDALSSSRVDLAYMTISDLERHVTMIRNRHINTVRREILRALFNDSTWTFTDDLRGSLTIQPLANGDSVEYPPVVGGVDLVTEDHYLASGYLASAISDTNNPIRTIREDLDEHYAIVTGGSNVVVFINNAQTEAVKSLTGFDPVNDRFIRVGQDTDVPINLPTVPGKILGRVSEAWVVEWRNIPANYMFGTHFEFPAPLLQRVDLPETGLPTGLSLVAEDEQFPLKDSQWHVRFGIGAGNRLNGVAMELTAGAYTVPTGLTR